MVTLACGNDRETFYFEKNIRIISMPLKFRVYSIKYNKVLQDIFVKYNSCMIKCFLGVMHFIDFTRIQYRM